MLLNDLRNKSFWLLDTLKGRKIKKHLNQITKILDDPKSNASISLRQKSVEAFLKHATNTTPFYKKYDGIKNIEDFPVIKKSIIKESFEAFKSEAYINHNIHKVSTSGSTGLSFFLYQNKNKRLRNYADSIYLYAKANYKIGSPLYKLIVWHSNNKKGYLKAWLLNMVQYDVSQFTGENISQLVDMLSNDRQKNKVILCYASALESLAKYLEKNELFIENHGIKSIVSISEYLSTYTKTTLETFLDVPVFSRYSNEEMGMIAQQTTASSSAFIVNHASYYVEILNLEDDKHVNPGDIGRIVVTDLYNYAMPMIRFDTGDLGRYKFDAHGVMQLTEIEGRKMDVIYSTEGLMMSSYVTHAIFNKYYKDLKQYQFIQQEQKLYEVKLNVKGSSFKYEKELINSVKAEMGEDADVKISYVNEIPPLSSGKRRKVINNHLQY